MSPRPSVGAAEQIRVRPVGDGFAYASLVCGGWSVSGIRVRACEDGPRIEWPYSESSSGRRFSVVVPPAGLRERLEAQIAAAFRVACARAGP